MAVYTPEVMSPDYIDLPRKGGIGLIDIEECVKKRVLAWMPEEWRRVDAAVLKEKVLLDDILQDYQRRRKEEAVSNWNENSPGYRQMAA